MIHVDQLTKYYDSFCAVDHISLDIAKGEVLGLLGPNGAGKTTTLRMLTGYFRPTSGTIRVKDHTMDEEPLAIKRLMGYLPESAPLYHSMLVYDYLDYVARLRGIDSSARIARIKTLADMCDIRPIMHKPINTLSKGLKQRVGLAHAMMNDPEILVLDEPTSGLDPNQIVEIRDIIREIGLEKTIILSTHILPEAEATCDRIVIINKGKIIADGTAEALKAERGGHHALHLNLANADADRVVSTLGAIEGVIEVNRVDEIAAHGTLQFEVVTTADKDLRGAIYQGIRETDWIILEFRQESRNLETIFRELTMEN